MTTAADATPRQSRLATFFFSVVMPFGFLVLMALGIGWIAERQDIKAAEKQRQEIAAGVALTARGCPAARAKIREIAADGTYSRREIEILDALVTAEQARPGGMAACRAPSWRWSWGEWIVSGEYAQ